MTQQEPSLPDFEKYGENTEVQCKLAGDKYPNNQMEAHLVAVHCTDGPKEKYIDDQSCLVRSVSGTDDLKSIPKFRRKSIGSEMSQQ